MGEHRAVVESIVGNVAVNAGVANDNHLSTTGNAIYLCNFQAGNHIYVHTEAFGYNKCKFTSTLESLNGEKNA